MIADLKGADPNPLGLSVWHHPADSPVNPSSLEKFDITGFVTSININLRLTRPWETLELGLALPGRHGVINRGANRLPGVPSLGDWVVVQARGAKSRNSKDVAAVFLGRVSTISPTATVTGDGRKDFRRVTVGVDSWCESLGKNQVYVALLAKESVGTLFASKASDKDRFIDVDESGLGVQRRRRDLPRSWGELMTSIFAGLKATEASEFKIPNESTAGFRTSFQSDALGKAFEKMWVSLATMRVPSTLAGQTIYSERRGDRNSLNMGEYLGDVVPVVYNQPTAEKYAPRMTVEPVPGWTVEGVKSIYPQGQSSLDLILGSFMADQNMVEIFPTLEPYDEARSTGGDRTEAATEAFYDRQFADEARRGLAASDPGDLIGNALRAGLNSGIFTDRTKQVPQGNPASGLAKALGVNPVIVFRVKPWRTQELDDYITNSFGPYGAGAKVNGRLNDRIFRGITWHRKTSKRDFFNDQGGDISHGFRYGEDMIQSWVGEFNDADHVNCVSVSLPGQTNSALQWLDSAGLPIVTREDINIHGLRHFPVNWPFFPPMEEVEHGDSKKKSKPLGLLESLYTVAAQASQFMGNADRFLTGTVTLAKFSPELRPGMTAEFDVQDLRSDTPTLTAYVDQVQHVISVDPNTGAIQSTTTVTYSRGALDPKLYTQQWDRGVNEVRRIATQPGGD
jgi:hypothetical protein